MSNRLVKESGNTKRADKNTEAHEIIRSMIEYIVAVVGSAISLLVPLYLKDGYHSVGTVKYGVYQWIVIVGFGLLILLTIFLAATAKTPEKNKLCATDWCVIAFLILCVVAAIAGGNFKECFMGYSGWNMGLFSMFSFGLIYFYFSRFGKGNKVVLTVLCVAAMIAFSIGVLHRLLIDPIGTYEGIADYYKAQFLSTLGQATWYSSFVCTVLPLGIGVFWCAKKPWLRVVGGIFSFTGFCTMVTQNSDSAYAALAGFFAVFLWFSLLDVHRMERFAEILLLFVAATRFMRLAFFVFPNEILILDKLSSFLIYHKAMNIILLAAVLFWLVFFLLAGKSVYSQRAAGIVRRILYSLLLVFLVLIAAHVLLSAKGLLPESITRYTGKIPYLVWGDNWGNGRGRTWAFSLQMFADMDLLHKLFGVGPDGYAPYAYTLYQERLAQMWGERTLTNAHNEWMNAVINYGLAGAAAYIGIFVTAIRSFAAKQENQPVIVGFIACIVSYMCHNFFCYQQVCCTPFLFMIVAAGIYYIRKEKQ